MLKAKAKDLILKAKAKAKDLTFKAKAKDSKFVLEDTSRPRTKAKDNNTALCTSLQTDNHNNTTSFYTPDALPDAQPTVPVFEYCNTSKIIFHVSQMLVNCLQCLPPLVGRQEEHSAHNN